MAQARRDENHITTLIGASSVDLETPTLVAADPVTNELLVQLRPENVTNFMLEVVKGNVPGHSAINKFGQNPAVATTGEDVWSGGGTYAFYPTTAQNMEILSDSANDTAAGTGARTVQVFGLDENWEEATETVILNGTTPVALTNTYIRMFRAVVLTAGSVETNDGNLIVRIVTVGTVAIYIVRS